MPLFATVWQESGKKDESNNTYVLMEGVYTCDMCYTNMFHISVVVLSANQYR